MTDPGDPEGQDRPRYATCGAKTRSGGKCRRPAGWGTDHAGIGRCKLHLGSTGNHVANAEREKVKEAARKLGIPKDVDVETAMLDLIREAAGNVDFYRSLVQELEQGRRLIGGDPMDDPDVEIEEVIRLADGRPSIAGRIKADTLEGRPHVLVVLYNEERDRLQKYLREAAALGIRARQVEAAEQQGRMIVAVLRAVTADLGLSGQQRQLLPGLVRKHWEAISANAVEVA